MLKRVLGVLALTVLAGGCGDSLLVTSSPAPPPLTMAIVSGNNQQGMHNLPMAEPFMVRVTNSAGQGIAGVEVYWTVTSGGGAWIPWQPAQAVTTTDAEGMTGVRFRPTVAGPSTSTVSAGAGGLQGSPLMFTVGSDGYRILFGPSFDVCADFDPPWFEPHEITVPVGAAVEWVGSCEARIVSQSVPAGGQPFDSGLLIGQSFRFVPHVPGEWTYVDVVYGRTGGKLIVR